MLYMLPITNLRDQVYLTMDAFFGLVANYWYR